MTGGEASPTGPGLLEREDVRGRLRALLEQVEAGSGGALAIEAEAGLGKSSVLHEAAERARGAGCTVLAAAGDQLELELAFSVVRQLLAPAVRDPSPTESLLVGPAELAGPALGLPVPSDRTGPADPLAQALHGLHWLCLDLAERHRRLLLIVDDAHWADLASLRFLSYLARRVQDTPVGLVVAFRPAEGEGEGERAALLAALGIPLSLPPLTPSAAAVLVRRHRPDADETTCHDAHTASGGNPLLLTELAVELRDRSFDGSQLDGTAVGDGSMARAVARRVDRLGSGARRLAEAIALFPSGAPLRHAAEVAGLEPVSAVTLADSLAQSLVIGSGHPLVFRHPLLRASVLAGIPAARRAHDHGRIADLLAAEGADPDETAAHVALADPAGRADWAEALVAAADRAAAAGAPEAALALLARAAAEPPPSSADRLAVRLRTGMAELAIGAPTSADTLLEVLGATVEQDARLPVVLPLAQAMAMNGRIAEAVPLLEAEARRFEATDADMALRLRGEAFWIAWQDATLRDDAWRLLGVFEAVEGSETLAQRIALAYRAHAALATLRPASEIADLALAAVADGVMAEHGLESGAPMSYAVTALGACDRIEEARAVLVVADQAFRDRGELIGIPMAQAQLAWIELLAGDLAAAEAAARLAMAALETQPPQHLGAPWARAMLALALLERGDVAAAAQTAGEDDPGEGTSFAVTLLAARGEVRSATGDLRGAIDDLRRAAAWAERKQLGEPAGEEVVRRRELALVLARAGHADEARELAGQVLAEARRVGGARQLGESLRAHALVTGGASSITELQEAVEVLAGSPARLAEAKATVDLGAALRRANRRVDAREPLRRGLDMARRCGAARLAERAEVELRSTGARPRRLVLTGVDALTPSEKRVAGMAADGATNREIAQALFVTLRTVEGHLSHAFGKLDVATRDQLPEALRPS